MYYNINGYPVQEFISWGEEKNLLPSSITVSNIEQELSLSELEYLADKMVEEKGEYLDCTPHDHHITIKVKQSHEGSLVLVANVKVDSSYSDEAALERALFLTCSFGNLSWTTNSDVLHLPSWSVPIRNTQEGDVLVIRGKSYILEECGFNAFLVPQ